MFKNKINLKEFYNYSIFVINQKLHSAMQQNIFEGVCYYDFMNVIKIIL